MLARDIARSKGHIDDSLPRPVVIGTDINVIIAELESRLSG
jgi:hypothetical protein